MAKAKVQNEAANTTYFNKLKENKAVVALPSGLHYEIIKQGDGATPKATDNVKVHYTGKLEEGRGVHDSI